MARIFISYRREDTIAHAGRLYDRLSSHFGKQQVFMDVDTIEPGSDFVAVLQDTVASCDVLIAVIGRQWLTIKDEDGQLRLTNPEDFVRLEIGAALQRKILLIPVLVGGSRMPRSNELPEDLAALVRRQAVDIPDVGFHTAVSRLIEFLDAAERSVEVREKAERERLAREAEEREQAARVVREAEAQEKAERERLAREAEKREQAARAVREAEAQEKAERERLAREAEKREQAARAVREAEAQEKAERERLAREVEKREQAARAVREAEAREKAERERLAREVEKREQAARAVREAEAREKAKRELPLAMLEFLKVHKSERDFYVHPDIPAAILRNVRNACSVPEHETVLGVVDCTLFGSAKHCLLFGSANIYIRTVLIDLTVISYRRFAGMSLRLSSEVMGLQLIHLGDIELELPRSKFSIVSLNQIFVQIQKHFDFVM